MMTRMFAFAAIVLASAAVAAAPSPAGETRKLSDIVAHLESRYHGEVTAIALDASGDKPAHYHVDMLFRDSGVAKFDLDAATGSIASRDVARLAADSATLPEATAIVADHVRGEVIAAELDSAEGALAHYDIDVRLSQGAIARLKVDPATRQLGWRAPPIVTP